MHAEDDHARWRAVLRHFDVDEAGVSGAQSVYVVVNGDAWRAIDLEAFVHPPRANYIFGPDEGERDPIPAEALRVTIPGKCQLYASQAAAIVLWDRAVQMGGLD